MSFRLDDLSAPDSVKISFNLNEDILSKGSHLSNFSNRNIINNSNLNKNSQIYNPYNQYNQYPSPYQVQSPRNSQVTIPLSSKNNQIITNAPIKLIDFSHGFQINPQALNFLRSIKEEIIIVSVVGKARTGKSYLMNLLLDLVGKNNGFQVASSLQSCTKGIWLWGTPKNSLNGNAKIVFLDSEGTSSTDKSTRTYDSRIFALVVLISSLFLYNTYSNIDENGINELSLAAHLSNAITTNTNINKDELLTELSPKFIWIIRDFTLEKVHPETGEEISSKEYLELCLKNKRCGKGTNENNVIRENIIKFFPERDCVTLVRPVDSENDLKRLNTIPYNNLKPEFKMEFKKLKDKIFKEALPKKLNGKKLTGPALATLIEEFVKVINSGKIPNINNTWDSVIEKDVTDAFYKSYEIFKVNVNILKLGQNNVYDNPDLLKKLYNYKYISLNNFDNLLQSNGDTFKQNNYKKIFLNAKNNLIYKIDASIKKIVSQNSSLSTNYCSGYINNLFRPFDSRLNQNLFSIKNYNDINLGLNEVMNRYEQIGKGPLKDETGFEYYRAKEKVIIKYIKDLTQKENEMNIKKMDNNIKLAQADLNDMNNMKRVIDEKERINVEKIKRLENDNVQLDSDVNELKEILDKKKSILKNLKKRNAQSLNNRNKLNEMNMKNNSKFNNGSGKPDIILNESVDEGNNNDNNNYGNENNGQKAKKRQKETGCECFII
jgi:hypothetical protein